MATGEEPEDMAFDDDAHRGFIEPGGGPPGLLESQLSWAALRLHHVAVEEARPDRPRFVSDAWLSGYDVDSTSTVVELELAGLWDRVRSGYVMRDEERLRRD